MRRGGLFSAVERSAYTFHQGIVRLSRSAQLEHGHREVPIAPAGAQGVMVLQYGGTEFVVVCVVPLEKDQPRASLTSTSAEE